MRSPNRLVAPRLDGKWSVVIPGVGRTARIFSRQIDAVKFAKSALASGGTVYLHDKTGKVQRAISAGAFKATVKRSAGAKIKKPISKEARAAL